MYGSVDDAVLDLAMEPNRDARALYVSIEAPFRANKESRAVVLEREFHGCPGATSPSTPTPNG
ncbi:hypothetical protein U9M48_015992 [Paspalum notatum var. saurae]|uniref:Uncharacterized protein n=1 Tax=Paspalum notatum var. saurae TaxID=547442 RepID=A0AAQ3T4L9_PASNO